MANNSGATNPAVGLSALRVPMEARPHSGMSVTAETVMSSRTETQTEHAPDQRVVYEGSGSEDRVIINSSQSGGKSEFR